MSIGLPFPSILEFKIILCVLCGFALGMGAASFFGAFFAPEKIERTARPLWKRPNYFSF